MPPCHVFQDRQRVLVTWQRCKPGESLTHAARVLDTEGELRGNTFVQTRIKCLYEDPTVSMDAQGINHPLWYDPKRLTPLAENAVVGD